MKASSALKCLSYGSTMTACCAAATAGNRRTAAKDRAALTVDLQDGRGMWDTVAAVGWVCERVVVRGLAMWRRLAEVCEELMNAKEARRRQLWHELDEDGLLRKGCDSAVDTGVETLPVLERCHEQLQISA